MMQEKNQEIAANSVQFVRRNLQLSIATISVSLIIALNVTAFFQPKTSPL